MKLARRLKDRYFGFMLAVLGACALTAGGAAADTSSPDAATGFIQTVEATHPLVFFPLAALEGHSVAGQAKYTASGGVTVIPGAPLGVGTSDNGLALNGTDGYVKTDFHGGIGNAGSMMVWVNLAELPSKALHILYVGGESERANDFDLQFESDGGLHFYTAAGSNLKFVPPAATLLGPWHMIVVTVDFNSGARAIYWDGAPVAKDTGGGKPTKTSEFTLGESTVFTGRFFNGSIDEAALWGRALGAAEVAKIYASTT
jgi:hypothetical protein